VTIHTQAYTLTPEGQPGSVRLFTTNCGVNQKAVSGGFDSDGFVFNLDTAPTAADDGWLIFLVNSAPVNATPLAATGTLYVTCLG
jgi:hypothetical protein